MGDRLFFARYFSPRVLFAGGMTLVLLLGVTLPIHLVFLEFFIPLPLFILAFFGSLEDVSLAGLIPALGLAMLGYGPRLISFVLFYFLPALALTYFFLRALRYEKGFHETSKKKNCSASIYESHLRRLQIASFEVCYGRFLLGMAVFVVVILLSLDIGGTEIISLKQTVDHIIDMLPSVSPEVATIMVQSILYFLPLIWSMGWLITLVFNLVLAYIVARFVLKKVSYRLTLDRWIVFPAEFFMLIGMGGLILFVSDAGVRQLVYNLLPFALLPFLIEGFALLVYMNRHMIKSHFFMPAIGLVSLIFGWPFLLICAIGFIEPWLGLRARIRGQREAAAPKDRLGK